MVGLERMSDYTEVSPYYAQTVQYDFQRHYMMLCCICAHTYVPGAGGVRVDSTDGSANTDATLVSLIPSRA